MKLEEKKLYKYLSLLFWMNIVVLTIGFLLLLLSKGPDLGSNVQTSVTLERYAIILTLASIPLALKMFHSMLQKNKHLPSIEFRKKYTRLYILRIMVLDLVVMVNLIGFYLYESNNFIYMTIILLVAILFCYPSRDAMMAYKKETKDSVEDNELQEEEKKKN